MATDTAIAQRESKPQTPAAKFQQQAVSMAGGMLRDWVGPERAGEAAGRISAALSAAAAAAKDPGDFYACTARSVGQCIAIAALTGIMPGTGATALAYVVPKRPRQGEQPQLQFWFSHRGLAALASRCGFVLIAAPVGMKDMLTISDGEVSNHEQDPDSPPLTWDDLRGVMVIVKNRASGKVIYRGWMPKVLIDERRQASDTYRWAEGKPDWAKQISPWHTWPVPMAMKCAMHYAIARGWCVIDDAAATRALSVEQQQDVIEVVPDDSPRLENFDDSHAGDELADMLESRRPTTTADSGPPLDRQILDRISSAKTPDDIDDIAEEIKAAVNDDRLAADQAAGLTQALQDRENVLSGKGKAGK